MADEITTSSSVRILIDGVERKLDRSGITYDTDSNAVAGDTQSFNITHDEIDFGEVTTPGPSEFVNLDDMKTLYIGVDVGGTFYSVVKISPGATAMFEPASTDLYASADDSGARMAKLITEVL